MLLISFAAALQAVIVAERILHLTLSLFFSSKRSPLKGFSGRLVWASLFDTLAVAISLPFQMLFVILSGIAANIYVGFVLVILVAGLAMAADSSGAMTAYLVNAYNGGLGLALNKFLVTPLVYLELILSDAIPLYNSVTWLLGRIFWEVIELLEQSIDVLPDLASNMALFFSAVGQSGASATTKLVRCWGFNEEQPDLDCVGNTLATSLDVMTPSVYLQGAVTNFHTIVSSLCSPILVPLNVAMYPLLDVNLYMFLHSNVNWVWSLVCGSWVQRHQRCAYGAAAGFDAGERAVMCMPDFNVALDFVKAAITSAGQLVDNWLDILLLLLERAIGQDSTRGCEPARVGVAVTWNSATDMLGDGLALQVVGLTRDMFAITNGESTLYRSLVQGSKTLLASDNWPFRIEPRYGVAAVRHSQLLDSDYGGEGRTGLLGCQCLDSEAGIEVVCASVPFLDTVDDSPAAYNASTIIRVNFPSPVMVRHMRCRYTQIKVTSLRFSRKRASVGRSSGYDSGFRDEFDSLGDFGEKTGISTADAAIYISPACRLDQTDLACLPNAVSCFPFCMGLHVSGQTAQNITAYNARRWRESINVQQVDCLTEALAQSAECDSDRPTAVSEAFGFEYEGSCALDAGTCVASAYVSTNIPLSQIERDSSLQAMAEAAPYIRLQSQPFVMAGDIMLFIEPATGDGDDQLVVSRLYDNNRGDYTLTNEQLTLANAAVRVPVKICDVPSNNDCRVEAVRAGAIVAPEADRLDPLVSHAVAVSEWGVHWADNPDNSVLANQVTYCAEGRVNTGITVLSSYRRPRVWTLRATRLSLSGQVQIVAPAPPVDEDPLASYMVVPDWIDISTPCTQEVNLKIVDIEYLNPENLLVTVLRAAPKNYDINTGTVCEGCAYDYSFYFLHPNLHRCVEPSESTDTFFTCWRTESEGMFLPQSVPRVTVAGLGTLCPALRRMPQLGAIGANVGNAGLETLRMILDIALVVPVGLIAGTDFYKLRTTKATFHPVLDSSGTSLFRVDEVIEHLDKAAFHLTNSFVRIMAFFEEAPGYDSIQPVVVGTAKILQFSGDSILLEGPLLSLFRPAKQMPVQQSLDSAGAGVDASPIAGKESKVLTTVKSSMKAFASAFRYVMRLFKPVSSRLLKGRCTVCQSARVGAALNIVNFVPSILADSSGDFRRSFTDNLRLQCDGLGNIFGTTNPVATSLRHACIIVPDTLDAVLEVVLVLTVDYPMVACACSQTQERNPVHVIEQECLLQSSATRNRVNLQELRKSSLDNTARGNICFAIMDTANTRLMRAWDNVFSRMARFTAEFARCVDYLVVGVFDLNDGGNCDNFVSSPYVISIIPYPIDYFAGCVHTFDCRVRCRSEMQAFELALAAATAEHTKPPSFRTTQSVRIESRFFKEKEVMRDEHLPPFEIVVVVELSHEACNLICNNRHAKNRCSAVAGPAVGEDGTAVLGTAYYCIPADMGTSVFAAITDLTRPLPTGSIEEAFFATTDRVLTGSLDVLVVMTRMPSASALTLITEAGQHVTLAETVDQASREPALEITAFTSLERLWVLPVSRERDTVVVYVAGLQYVTANSPPVTRCARIQVPGDFSRPAELAQGTSSRPCFLDVDQLLPEAAEPVCLVESCSVFVFVPTGRASTAPVERVEFDTATDKFTSRLSYETTSGTSASVGSRVGIDKKQTLFRTQQGVAARNHRRVSAMAVGRWTDLRDSPLAVGVVDGIAFDFLLSRPTADAGVVTSWLVNLRMTLQSGASFQASIAESLERVEDVAVEIECSVDNCIGCHPNGPRQALFEDLQAKCFIAQQCGVTQCAGTLVNLRKPLCNFGKALASPTDLLRVALMGTWTAISETIMHTVELSHARRNLHQITWGDEVATALVCNAKDVVTEAVTTITAVIGGADLWREQMHRDGILFRGAQVDPRYHARVIMTVAAMSGLLSNILNGPLYLAVAAQQTLSCALNDTVVTVQEIADPDGLNTRIELGSRRLADARQDLVGLCLSRSMGSVMQELDSDTASREGAGYRISDAITRIPENLQRSAFEPFAHVLDAGFSYMLGIVHGLQDFLQTVDWYHCKPPVTHVASVSRCVCGDEAFSVVDARKEGTVASFDFWCSGPLIFSSTLEEDILVWNRYSLAQLLAVPGVGEFAECLTSTRDCVPPSSALVQDLNRQGVEVLQVITRCRSNYQEKKWDDGALVLGTFSRDQWAVGQLEMTSSSQTGFRSLRDQLVRKSQSGIIAGLDLPDALWQCLYAAATAVQWNHRCLEAHVVPLNTGLTLVDQYFMYAPAATENFEDTDACQTFTGNVKDVSTVNGATHSKSIWSMGSRNRIPVAMYHYAKAASTSSRSASAEAQLSALLDNEILPELQQLVDSPINVGKIETRAWTLEGDHLHQLIDCVIIGPYAAADLHSSFRMSDNEPFEVPQYHRGDASSRVFSEGTATGGSESRQQIMDGAKLALEKSAGTAITDEAARIVIMLRNRFKVDENMKCKCPVTEEADASMECCSLYSRLEDISFGTRDILGDGWDLAEETLSEIFTGIIGSDMLRRDIWASESYTSSSGRTFSEIERFELHHSFMFDFNNPVREYSLSEALTDMRTDTLWQQCTSLLSAAFFTLPLREGSEDVDADTDYDPTTTPESSEVERYSHAVERAVERILERSREDNPHFWTHVHRYVPSDSVWCESPSPEPLTSTGPLTTGVSERSTNVFSVSAADSSFSDYSITFNPDTIYGPTVDNVAYPGHLQCLCGWKVATAGGDQCAPALGACWDPGLSDINSPLQNEWDLLCARGVVSSRSDYFVQLQVMEQGLDESWMEDCVDAHPSVHWGLIDPDNVKTWMDGSASSGATFGMLHELATKGPGGLRFGLLGAQEGTDTLLSYIRKQKVLRTTHSQANFAWQHTIAQPYCESSVGGLLTALGSDLTKHFPDVFFPMAHSVEEAPVSAYCSRYTIEVAVLRVLERVLAESPEDDRIASAVLEQRMRHRTWRQRCFAQVQQIGICELRGVYDIRPPDEEYDRIYAPKASECAFQMPLDNSHGCEFHYVTTNCLVYCRATSESRGLFYDPCRCGSGCSEGNRVSFTVAGCSGQELQPDVRDFAVDEVVRLQSMHWPVSVPVAEAGSDAAGETLDSKLRGLPTGTDAIKEGALLDSLRAVVASRMALGLEEEGVTAPDGACDDLRDYWAADAQHPVGYHPSTACACRDSRVRGFDSWMSASADGSSSWRIDPRRLRNFTQFGQAFGSAHLTCDRGVYGREGVMLNPFHLQTRWNPARRADPAVPVLPDADTVDEMTTTGSHPAAAEAYSQRDTAARDAAHTTGVIRGWWRSHAVQTQSDATWPLFESEYGLSEGDDTRTETCAFPSLHTCRSSSECLPDGLDPGALTCLLAPMDSEGEQHGVCSSTGTCFMHSHCPDERLCSGTGVCVEPIVYFHNDLLKETTVELYSEGHCSTDTWGASAYQNIPSYARDHGMCKFRDWFHYRDTVRSLQNDDLLYSVESIPTRRTSDRSDDTLFTRGLMRVEQHPCDRSFQHTAFKNCATDISGKRGFSSDEEAAVVSFTQSWRRDGGADGSTTTTPMCYMINSQIQPVSGFLNPYMHVRDDGFSEDTLSYAGNDIARCSDFNTCPEIPFSLEAISLIERQVLLTELSSEGALTFPGTSRKYSINDALTCHAFGYTVLLGETTQCVVDRYTSPLLDVIFGDQTQHVAAEIDAFGGLLAVRNAMLTENFAFLISKCPGAFGGSSQLNVFKEIFYKTTMPYLPEDKEAVGDILNSLLIQIFGLETPIENIQDYISLSRCAQHIQNSLGKVQKLALRDFELPYAFHDPADPPAPGRALYLFSKYSPIQISLEWVWKCHITARGREQGGALPYWRSQITRGLNEDLFCENFAYQRMSANQKPIVTVRKKMQIDTHLLDIIDPGEPILTDLLSEIRKTVTVALDAMGITAWEDLYCMSKKAEVQDPSCEHPMNGTANACWEHFGRTLGAVPPGEGSGLYSDVESIIIGSTAVNLGLQNIDSLLQSGLLVNGLDDLSMEVRSDVNFIAAMQFPHLTEHMRTLDEESLPEIVLEPVTLPPPQHLNVMDASNPSTTASPQGVYPNPPGYATQDDADYCEAYVTPAAPDTYKLTHPEFSVRFGTLPSAAVNIIPGQNRDNVKYLTDQHSLTHEQALYILLHIFRYEMYNSQTFRVGNLHRVLAWDVYQQEGALSNEARRARATNTLLDSLNGPCGEVIESGETNRQHRRMRDCLSALRRERGWEIPSGGGPTSILRLHLTGSRLTSPFYPAHGPRPLPGGKESFLDDLLSEDQANFAADLVCARRGARTLLLNPYWASDFDFEGGTENEACDTRRLGVEQLRAIDARCLTVSADETCASLFSGYANVINDPLKLDPTCVKNDGNVITRQALENPLCDVRSVVPETCLASISTLRRSRGVPVASVYETVPVPTVQAGFWNYESSVFRGDRASTAPDDELTALRLLSTDIGGQYMQFVISENNIYLACADLHDARPQERCKRSLSLWKGRVEESWALQHEVQRAQWPPSQTSADAKCPLRWQDSLSGASRSFSVRLPSKDRNAVRFRHITGSSDYAHPTVISVDKIIGLSAPGYIADSHLCLDASSNGGSSECHGTALLAEALQALRVANTPDATASTWTTVRRLGLRCPAILDWPNGAYVLSDLSQTTRQLFDTECSAVARLPSFAVRYEQRASARGSPAAVMPGSNEQGGVCRMGRLARISDELAPSAVDHCERGDGILTCYGYDASTEAPWEQVWGIAAPPPPSLPQRVNRRRQCRGCDSHISQSVLDGVGSPISTSNVRQLSVGLPRRFSPERLLAQHIRRLVCPSPASDGLCPALATATSAEVTWDHSNFADDILALATFDDSTATPAADDTELWARNWIFCDQSREVSESERCSGSMTRSEWVNPATRTDRCLGHINSVLGDTTEPIQFCKLSGGTSDLCQKVQTWNAKVLRILCEAAGLPECPRFGFFYTPTAYSVINREFVADTVDTFYARVGPPGSCPVRATDGSDADEELLRECASNSMASIKTVIETARHFVHKIIEVMYYTVMSFVQMLKLFILFLAGAVDAAVRGTTDYLAREAQILMKYFELLMRSLGDILALITEAVLKLFWEDGIGKAIYELIDLLCETVNMLHYIFVGGFCAIVRIFGEVLNALCFGSGCGNFAIEWGSSGECAPGRVPLECVVASTFEGPEDPVVLSVATRCWSTYTTFFGDTGPLSCTPSDTCRLSPLSSQRVKCTLCPETGAGYDQFGCDAALKMCTCSVPRTIVSRCTANLECAHADATCKYVDSEMALSGSAVRCPVCSSPPVCFVGFGEVAGTCACPLIDMPFSQCRPDEHKQSVYPRQFNSLCFLDQDEANARSQDFVADVERLVTVPCSTLLPSQTWCMQLRQNAAPVVGGYYVVGFDTISMRAAARRLLSTDADLADEPGNISFAPPDWAQVQTQQALCRDVFSDPKRVLRSTFDSCSAAYTSSAETAFRIQQLYNVSVPPCAFCSLADAMAGWESLEGLPGSAWILVARRHSPLPMLLTSVERNSRAWRQSAEVLRHDLAGHVANTMTSLFPDPASADKAMRRFFIAPPSDPLPPARRLLSTDELVGYFDDLQRKLFDPSISRSYEQLLSTSWQSQLPPLSVEQIETWQRQWPPQFVVSESTCDFVGDWILLAQKAGASVPLAKAVALQRAETCQRVPLPLNSTGLCRPRSVLAEAWPRLLDSSVVYNQSSPASSFFITKIIVDAGITLTDLVGINSRTATDFVFSVVETARGQFQCDLEAVQTCSQWRVNLLMGATVVFVFYGLFFIICNTLGLTLVAVLATPALPFFVWHVCYGYSLFCIPTIPACFFADMRATMQGLFPVYLLFPPSLLRDTVACRTPTDTRIINPACVVPCSDEPLAYTSWHAVAAWLAAEVGGSDLLTDLVQWVPLIDRDPLLDAIVGKQLDLQQGGDLLWGNRVCAALHAYRVLPYLFLLFLAAFLVQALARSFVTFVLSLASVLSKLAAHELTPTQNDDDDEEVETAERQ